MVATDPVDGFGARLRRWRERTQPEELGLPRGSRRRVQGLRREELAAFSGVSVEYLTRLEQGGATNPSPEVVAALGRSLRLPRLEVELLHQLAGHAGPRDLEVPRHLAPGVHRLIDRLPRTPVAAYDATWTLLAANEPWRWLRGDLQSRPGYNLVHEVFAGEHVDREALEYRDRLRRSLVADLRVSAARYPADRGMQAMLQDLLEHNAAFAATWAEGRAQHFATEPKRLTHPELGELWFDCDVLSAADGDTRIVVYTAAHDSPGEAALGALADPRRPGAATGSPGAGARGCP